MSAITDARTPERNPHRHGIPLSSATTGAISELIVSADLLKLGLAVFRSMSAACPCDLIAAKGNTLLRVEVRSGKRRRNGELAVSKPLVERYDVLAIVLPDGEIIYQPEINKALTNAT